MMDDETDNTNMTPFTSTTFEAKVEETQCLTKFDEKLKQIIERDAQEGITKEGKIIKKIINQGNEYEEAQGRDTQEEITEDQTYKPMVDDQAGDTLDKATKANTSSKQYELSCQLNEVSLDNYHWQGSVPHIGSPRSQIVQNQENDLKIVDSLTHKRIMEEELYSRTNEAVPFSLTVKNFKFDLFNPLNMHHMKSDWYNTYRKKQEENKKDLCDQMHMVQSIALSLDHTYDLQAANFSSLWDMGLQFFCKQLSICTEVEHTTIPPNTIKEDMAKKTRYPLATQLINELNIFSKANDFPLHGQKLIMSPCSLTSNPWEWLVGPEEFKTTLSHQISLELLPHGIKSAEDIVSKAEF
eukprot:Gb_39883 [translate_table: standard]